MGGGAKSASEASGGEKVQLHVRCTNGNKFSVEADLSSTVLSFKAILVEKSDVPADRQRLIHKGRVLKDDNFLESYGLQNDDTVHLVRGAPSSTVAAAAGESGTTTNTLSSIPPGGDPVNSVGNPGRATGVGNFDFPDFHGNVGAGFGTGLPEFQQIQQQLMQNPNLMREMMNMPAVQSLMNNPDLMRNLIMNNPRMREVIDRNPDLAHILNDPSTLRQTLDTARNPELMREMMRNTDRAMSNIEASPEGFNMLRRMYETVQEPLLNAATMGADGGNELASNPLSALFGAHGYTQVQTPSTTGTANNTTVPRTASVVPNTAPLPNPWNLTQNVGVGTGLTNTFSGTTAGTGGLGLSGVGLPDFGAFGGGIGLIDPAAMQQMLQNPDFVRMMQGLLSNPQYVNQPHLYAFLNTNPQLREMMQIPDFLQQHNSFESLQQATTGQLNQQRPIEVPRANGATNGTNAFDATSLFNLFGALRGIPSMAHGVNVVPPEELYASQLSQLQDMGFADIQANIRALSATGGNVHAAVEWLLGNPG